MILLLITDSWYAPCWLCRSEAHSRQIKGIAKGIEVLHTMSPPIVHGDIKSVSDYRTQPLNAYRIQANIVIDPRGNPLLTDFGLSRVGTNIFGAILHLTVSFIDRGGYYGNTLYSKPRSIRVLSLVCTRGVCWPRSVVSALRHLCICHDHSRSKSCVLYRGCILTDVAPAHDSCSTVCQHQAHY